MRAHRLASLLAALLIAGGVTFAQVGRGWSDWPTPYADAQRTSWLRTDPKISVESMSTPGFELQWSSKLDNQHRGSHALTQGIAVSGVTLFVPTSLVAGSANNLHMLDNDTGYVVWSRTFEGALPAATAACGGGITAAPTYIVSGTAAPTSDPVASAPAAGRANQGFRSLLGEPGQGVPVEPRGGGPGRGAGAAGGRSGRRWPVRAGRRLARQGAGIPGRSESHSRRPRPSNRRVRGCRRWPIARRRPAVRQGPPEAGAVPPGQLAVVEPCRGRHHDVCRDVWNLPRCTERRVRDRSRRARQAGCVLSHQWRQRRRFRRILLRRQHVACGDWSGHGERRRKGERDRRARSPNTAAQGLVHATRGRVRDRPHRLPARDEGRGCGRHEGRARIPARRGVARWCEPRNAAVGRLDRFLRAAARSRRRRCRPGRGPRPLQRRERVPRRGGFSFRSPAGPRALARPTERFATAPSLPSASRRPRVRSRSSRSGHRTIWQRPRRQSPSTESCSHCPPGGRQELAGPEHQRCSMPTTASRARRSGTAPGR